MRQLTQELRRRGRLIGLLLAALGILALLQVGSFTLLLRGLGAG
jgi:hypothetical protein